MPLLRRMDEIAVDHLGSGFLEWMNGNLDAQKGDTNQADVLQSACTRERPGGAVSDRSRDRAAPSVGSQLWRARRARGRRCVHPRGRRRAGVSSRQGIARPRPAAWRHARGHLPRDARPNPARTPRPEFACSRRREPSGPDGGLRIPRRSPTSVRASPGGTGRDRRAQEPLSVSFADAARRRGPVCRCRRAHHAQTADGGGCTRLPNIRSTPDAPISPPCCRGISWSPWSSATPLRARMRSAPGRSSNVVEGKSWSGSCARTFAVSPGSPRLRRRLDLQASPIS